MLSILRAAAFGLFTPPPASAPVSSDPASSFSLIIRSISRWAVGPPAIIRHERSATTIDALAQSSEVSSIRLDQSPEDLVRGMGVSFDSEMDARAHRLSEAG